MSKEENSRLQCEGDYLNAVNDLKAQFDLIEAEYHHKTRILKNQLADLQYFHAKMVNAVSLLGSRLTSKECINDLKIMLSSDTNEMDDMIATLGDTKKLSHADMLSYYKASSFMYYPKLRPDLAFGPHSKLWRPECERDTDAINPLARRSLR